jgi:hypothetical protein
MMSLQSRIDSPEVQDILKKIHKGMSREEVIKTLGQPDQQGCTSRKYKTPSIYKYGNLELWFEPWKDGKLVNAYIEDENHEDGKNVQVPNEPT